MIKPSDDQVIERAQSLLEEKYDWLEKRQKKCKSEGIKFDIDSEERAWILLKLAQHELLTVLNQ